MVGDNLAAMRPFARFAAALVTPIAALICATPAHAQSTRISCENFAAASARLSASYRSHQIPFASAELAEGVELTPAIPNRLDKTLLDTALASYDRHICRYTGSAAYGPSQIVIVDFAKPSSQPRLYMVDVITGQGLDAPIQVAHGIGSDPNDDGVADQFGNGQNSLMSSLGAARGAEMYLGMNGLSLRLDGLDASNSQMRARDIVAHSYAPERRRYFNSSLIAARGRPGSSEGCIVVAPEHRDWLFGILNNGGFLFAGLGGSRAGEMFPPERPRINMNVEFVAGTGN
jgi:L,D-transpeptidase catalytic domain